MNELLPILRRKRRPLVVAEAERQPTAEAREQPVSGTTAEEAVDQDETPRVKVEPRRHQRRP
jgi:hypothetical protein